MKKTLNKKAYTLLEMMLVIAIIIIIAAAVFSSSTSTLDKSKTAINSAYSKEQVQLAAADSAFDSVTGKGNGSSSTSGSGSSSAGSSSAGSSSAGSSSTGSSSSGSSSAGSSSTGSSGSGSSSAGSSSTGSSGSGSSSAGSSSTGSSGSGSSSAGSSSTGSSSTGSSVTGSSGSSVSNSSMVGGATISSGSSGSGASSSGSTSVTSTSSSSGSVAGTTSGDSDSVMADASLSAGDGEMTDEEEKAAVAQLVSDLGNIFSSSCTEGNAWTVGKCIVSNKPDRITGMLAEAGIDNAQAFVTNDNQMSNYATTLLKNNGISAAVSTTKIVSVTTDGTVLSDHKKNDTVNVVQYIYYETKINNKKYAVLFAYRETTATIATTSGNGTLTFDKSDTDGSSWNIVN